MKCLLGFIGFAPFILQISLSNHGHYSPWGQKIESAQKIHASKAWCEMHVDQVWWVCPLRFWKFCFFLFAVKTEVDVKCMHTNFGAPLVLKILLLSISFKISFWTIEYSSWGHKIDSAQQVHQVEVEDVSIYNNKFGG